jgi:hypothetical protein
MKRKGFTMAKKKAAATSNRGAGDTDKQIARLSATMEKSEVARAAELKQTESPKVIRLAALLVRKEAKPEIGLTARESKIYVELKAINEKTADAWKDNKLAEKSAAKK